MNVSSDRKGSALIHAENAANRDLAGQTIEWKIREFISRNLLFSENGFPYQDDDSFLQRGVIDSLGVLELVTFAGKEFGVCVEPVDVTPENFDSVNRLATYIRRKSNPRKEGSDACP